MTRLVALDTATWTGSVALLETSGDGPVRVTRDLAAEATQSHAAHLLLLLEQALADAGWERSSVDAYAATRGPGSFTGLRVALGTIRGLALAAARPAIGVGTLDALAASAGASDSERVPLLPAGRGEVFGARFDAASDPPREIVAPWVGPVEQAIDRARPGARVFGPGAHAFLERLRAAGYAGTLAALPGTVAAAAGKIALARLRAGAKDGDGLAPLYVRPPDAEIRPPQAPPR